MFFFVVPASGLSWGIYDEALENGWLAVFLPQAPTPMSGNVHRPCASQGRLGSRVLAHGWSLVAAHIISRSSHHQMIA